MLSECKSLRLSITIETCGECSEFSSVFSDILFLRYPSPISDFRISRRRSWSQFFVSCRFCVALLQLFALPRKYLPTPKEFICRIAAIICSAIDFFFKNRDERLKSLIKYFRVCVNRMRIKFQSELCKFSVCEEISSFMVSINGEQEENDQKIIRDDSFIQNSSWFAVISGKRSNFWRAQSLRRKTHHA